MAKSKRKGPKKRAARKLPVKPTTSPAPAPAANPLIVSSQAAAARFFGVCDKTIQRWTNEDPPMPYAPTRYDLAAIAKWLASSRAEARQAQASPRKVDLAELEEQKLQADVADKREAARMRRLKRLELQGTLVDRQAAEAEIESILREVSTRLDAIPAEAATEVPTAARPKVLARWKSKIALTKKAMRDAIENLKDS